MAISPMYQTLGSDQFHRAKYEYRMPNKKTVCTDIYMHVLLPIRLYTTLVAGYYSSDKEQSRQRSLTVVRSL